LTQVRAVKDGLVPEEQSWIGVFPDYSGAPIPARGVNPEILREAYTALIDAKALTITYQSLSRPEPSARVIEPHALAFDGWRWHARAFCRNDAVFKDFLISRIPAVGDISDRQADLADDQARAEEVTLTLVKIARLPAPHSGL
jgi:predicted DNA-binding transcriptional regulator YafY